MLCAEIQTFLTKQAVEVVSSEQCHCGLYSHFFLVPKKDGDLRPILDLRPRNRALAKRPLKMESRSWKADPPLVYSGGTEGRLFSHSNSPSSQALSEIRVQRRRIPVQSPAIWAGSGSTYIHKVCECSAFPLETQWDAHCK